MVNFSRRSQGPKERFDDFVTALRVLIKDCGFAEEERMLRDAIVLRSHSATVREKCLDKGNELTLEKAIQIGQNHEASQESMRVIDARVDEDLKVHTVQTKSRNHRGRQGKPAAAAAARKAAQTNCGRCGYPNSHESCPAYNSTCGYCRKRGHWSKMCRNKAKRGHKQPKATHAVEEMAENDQDDDQRDNQYQDMHLVNTVTEAKGHISEWWEKVELEGHSLQCQIDTGAAQSLLPYRDYVKIKTGQKLYKCDKAFQFYTKHPIPVEGYVSLPTCYKNKYINIKFYVVDIDQKPLIPGHDSSRLGLIHRIHTVRQPEEAGMMKPKEADVEAKLQEEYPEVEKGTATLPGTYSLKIDATIPPVVHGPRRQPQALRGKIRTKLNEMVKEGHIARVTEPTEWVNSMVVVVKGDKVRICLDPETSIRQ